MTKEERERAKAERLAIALRANLRRRKVEIPPTDPPVPRDPDC